MTTGLPFTSRCLSQPPRLTLDDKQQADIPFSNKGLARFQIVRPLKLIAETQPQLQPALLRLSAMISQSFMLPTSVAPFRRTARLSFTVFSAQATLRFFRSADLHGAGPRRGAVSRRRGSASVMRREHAAQFPVAARQAPCRPPTLL
jgi:hypothetical protein